MGYQSRDWRQSDPSRNYGRFRNQDESRQQRSDFDRPESDDDWSRSAEGVGDYGGYGGGQGGRYGSYAEEESSYRGEYSPRRFRYGQGRDWNDEQRGASERYGGARSGREDFGRGSREFEGSRFGRERAMEGWSGERYPHRDFTHGRGGDYGSGSSGRYFGSSGRDWRSDSTNPAYESGEGGGYGSGEYGRGSQPGWGSPQEYGSQQRYGSQYGSQYGSGYGSSEGGYGSSGSSGLTNWGRGSQRGKGPKGYERSDDRLKEVICERLSDDPDIDASEISINVTGGTVKLTGTVDSRADKYSVEEMVANCSGVKDVDNQLRVQSGRSQSQAGQHETASGNYSASSQEGYGQSTSRSTSTTTGTSTSKKQ